MRLMDRDYVRAGAGSKTALLEVGWIVDDNGDTVIIHGPRDASTAPILEVTPMARSLQDILDHADVLAKHFEDFDAENAEWVDGGSLRAVARAFQRSAYAERELADAVSAARADGHSWAAIGGMIGMSGEAARQRYGRAQCRPVAAAPRSRVARRGRRVVGASQWRRLAVRRESPRPSAAFNGSGRVLTEARPHEQMTPEERSAAFDDSIVTDLAEAPAELLECTPDRTQRHIDAESHHTG